MALLVIAWTPYSSAIALVGFACCAFIYLITWRIARRSVNGGWR